VQAEEDQKKAMGRFRRWASSKVPGAENMNVGSGAQIRQLLFAGVQNQKPEKGSLELERVFKVGLHYFQQSTAVHSLPALFIAADSASSVVAVAYTGVQLYRCRDKPTIWLQLRLLNRDITQ